jgi:hypothetical protein
MVIESAVEEKLKSRVEKSRFTEVEVNVESMERRLRYSLLLIKLILLILSGSNLTLVCSDILYYTHYRSHFYSLEQRH